MASEATVGALSLVSIGLVARYLSPTLFGMYLFVVSFASLFEVVTDMGVNAILVREVARRRDRVRQLAGAALLPKLLSAVATVALAVIGINVFEAIAGCSWILKWGVYLQIVAVSADAFTDIFISIVRAHQRMEFEALIKVFNRLLALSLVVAVVCLDVGFLGLFKATLAANITTSVIAFLFSLKLFGAPITRSGLSLTSHLVRESLPLGVGQILNRGYNRTNVIVIQATRTPAEVGFYGGAARLIEQLYILPISLVSAVFPVISELSQDAGPRLSRAFEKTLKLLSLVAFPLTGGFVALAAPLVALVFGPKFAAVALPLQVLALGIFANFGNMQFQYFLSALGQQAVFRRNMLFCFLANLVLAAVLIPTWGYVGACAGTIVASHFLFGLSYRSVAPYLEGVSVPAIVGRPLFASLAMVLFLRGLELKALPLAVPAGALVYGVSLLALRGISREEFQMAKEAILGRPHRTGGRA
jgi:O-antigen/teichoic acid export membrane protein